MFGKLKDRLKKSLSVFSKKTEEVAEESEELKELVQEESVPEVIEEPEKTEQEVETEEDQSTEEELSKEQPPKSEQNLIAS